MSEMMVDFTNTEFEARSLSSVRSGVSSRYTQGARSVADRSGTEIIEYHTYSAQAGATASTYSAQGATATSSAYSTTTGAVDFHYEDEDY